MIFFKIYEISVKKRNGNKSVQYNDISFRVYMACIFAHGKAGVKVIFAEKRITK